MNAPANVGVCEKCGSEIIFVPTPTNKFVPCNPRVLQIVTAEGKVVRGREAHFATCPEFHTQRAKVRTPEEKAAAMLYEVCPLCGGSGELSLDGRPVADRPCICKPVRVVPVGVSARQLERLVEEDRRRKKEDSPV